MLLHGQVLPRWFLFCSQQMFMANTYYNISNWQAYHLPQKTYSKVYRINLVWYKYSAAPRGFQILAKFPVSFEMDRDNKTTSCKYSPCPCALSLSYLPREIEFYLDDNLLYTSDERYSSLAKDICSYKIHVIKWIK